MKVLLVGNYQPDRQHSMQIYASMLAEGLRERGHGVQLLQPPDVLVRGFATGSLLAKWAGYADKFVLFRSALKRAASHADLVHICDHSNAMYVPAVAKLPHVVTCHDVLAIRSAMGHFPQNPVGPTGRLFQRRITNGLRQARHILCVSQKTSDDARIWLHIPAERLAVIPNALHWNYVPLGDAERAPLLAALGLAPHARYFLHVGGDLWYKNRAAVIAIFAELRRLSRYADARLVMAGGRMTQELEQAANRYGVRGQISEATNVSNEQLCALYSGALAMLFPSLEEGFGWPILEAQACGCPVAILNRPPMNDVAGGAAILMDAGNAHEAATAVARALDGSGHLRAAGIQNAAAHSRPRMLDATESLYERVITQETLNR